MVKMTYIAGMKKEQLESAKIIPVGLDFKNEIPPHYSCVLISAYDNSIVCLSDAFGGGVAWAYTKTALLKADAVARGKEMTSNEWIYLEQFHPELYKAINLLK